MNHPDAWQRLAAAARRPDVRDASAPYGFAVRVAALGLAAQSRPVSFLEHFSLRLSLRALGAACLLAFATAGLSYPSLVQVFSDGGSPAPSAAAAVPAAIPPPSAGAAVPAVPDAPAAGLPSSDDPVADLVAIVS